MAVPLKKLTPLVTCEPALVPPLPTGKVPVTADEPDNAILP